MTRLMRCRPCGKEIFASEGLAEEELNRIKALPTYPGGKKPVRSYFEQRCGFWHLTSQPGRERVVNCLDCGERRHDGPCATGWRRVKITRHRIGDKTV